MDAVFKALADPTRRGLLDELFRHDGQTLTALEARLPMTRFGVMKHLRVLEEAGLVSTKRRGREKLHFLNPVPIRLVHDRWVSKYAEPWAATLSRLKTHLEDETMQTVKTVSWAQGTAPVAAGTAVFEVFIKTTPERLWQAITDPEQRKQYSFGVETHSDWTPGSEYKASVPGVVDWLAGDRTVASVDQYVLRTCCGRVPAGCSPRERRRPSRGRSDLVHGDHRPRLDLSGRMAR